MKSIITQLAAPISTSYIVCFLLTYYTGFGKGTILNTFFTEPIYVITGFIIFAISCLSMGRYSATEDVEVKRRQILTDMHNKQEHLLDYIKLAKLLTNKDVDVLIKEYVSDLEAKYGIEVDK